ncbi:hypothetical protein ACFV4P_27260 [Kitasatospora sp. NPDC059795]|uniref:hypothetical protein n=1 Tax=Kitasatospora sp. NPDC059795 TaxID=3346949 RepID=UPI003660F2A3
MESLRVRAMRQVVGQLCCEQLPMAAAELLAEGDDSPTLRELAGCNGREPRDELEQLWGRALDELGVQRPGQEEAQRWALRDLAGRLHSGELDSLAEAVATVGGLEYAEGEPELAFCRIVMEGCCEGCVADGNPEALAEWEARVRAAAAALVAEGRRVGG